MALKSLYQWTTVFHWWAGDSGSKTNLIGQLGWDIYVCPINFQVSNRLFKGSWWARSQMDAWHKSRRFKEKFHLVQTPCPKVWVYASTSFWIAQEIGWVFHILMSATDWGQHSQSGRTKQNQKKAMLTEMCYNNLKFPLQLIDGRLLLTGLARNNKLWTAEAINFPRHVTRRSIQSNVSCLILSPSWGGWLSRD